MKLVFQYSGARDEIALDITNTLNMIPNSVNDPRDSLRKNTIKSRKSFTAFAKPIPPSEVSSSRSMNFFGNMIENVNGAAKNCSSCGGAK